MKKKFGLEKKKHSKEPHITVEKVSDLTNDSVNNLSANNDDSISSNDSMIHDSRNTSMRTQ